MCHFLAEYLTNRKSSCIHSRTKTITHELLLNALGHSVSGSGAENSPANQMSKLRKGFEYITAALSHLCIIDRNRTVDTDNWKRKFGRLL